jgi:hypothetical protein
MDLPEPGTARSSRSLRSAPPVIRYCVIDLWKRTVGEIASAHVKTLRDFYFLDDRPLAATIFYFPPAEMEGDVDNIVKLRGFLYGRQSSPRGENFYHSCRRCWLSTEAVVKSHRRNESRPLDVRRNATNVVPVGP